MQLSAYSYDILYHCTQDHGNADALSQIPVHAHQATYGPDATTLFDIGQLDYLPVSAKDIAAETRHDPILSKVVQYVKRRWSYQDPGALRPYWLKRAELMVEEECILWSVRVVIRTKLKGNVLNELHCGHPGVVRMKALSSSYVWWPGIDEEVDKGVKACTACQTEKAAPA